MGSKRKGPDEAELEPVTRYDDELLSANWNPVIRLIESSCARTLDDMNAKDDLSEQDIDALLNRFYRLGG